MLFEEWISSISALVIPKRSRGLIPVSSLGMLKIRKRKFILPVRATPDEVGGGPYSNRSNAISLPPTCKVFPYGTKEENIL